MAEQDEGTLQELAETPKVSPSDLRIEQQNYLVNPSIQN